MAGSAYRVTSKGLAQADEIRCMYIDADLRDVGVRHETLYFSVAEIIPDQKNNRQPGFHSGCQFTDGELCRTVPYEADYRAFGCCQFGANCCRDCVSEGTETAGRVK